MIWNGVKSFILQHGSDAGRQRDALVSRPEQHIESEPGGLYRLRVAVRQQGQAAAIVKTTRIEKVRAETAGFQGELAETQVAAFHG